MDRMDRRMGQSPPRCVLCGAEAALRTTLQVEGSPLGFVDCPRCGRAWFTRDGRDASLRDVAALVARYLGAPAGTAGRGSRLAPVVALGQARRMPRGSAAPPDGGFAVSS